MSEKPKVDDVLSCLRVSYEEALDEEVAEYFAEAARCVEAMRPKVPLAEANAILMKAMLAIQSADLDDHYMMQGIADCAIFDANGYDDGYSTRPEGRPKSAAEAFVAGMDEVRYRMELVRRLNEGHSADEAKERKAIGLMSRREADCLIIEGKED